MPCGVWTVSDIPDEQLALALAMAKLDHPLKIETQREADGQWTVISTFAPCEDGQDTQDAQKDGTNVTFAGVAKIASITNLPVRDA